VEFVVNGKTCNLALTPELWKLATTMNDKDAVLTGVLNNNTITVNSLKVAN
jgi:hypothetical protein